MAKAPETPIKNSEPYIGKYAHVVGKKYETEEIVMLADMLYDWMLANNSNYWIGDFLTRPDVMLNRNRIKDFCVKNDYFNQIYQQCKMLQERRLSLLSCTADKPTGWIFALKNVSGWRDNPEPINDDDKQTATVNIDEPAQTV
jgi:hypothetical protein